jgi:hypothetical protein
MFIGRSDRTIVATMYIIRIIKSGAHLLFRPLIIIRYVAIIAKTAKTPSIVSVT